MKKKVAGCGLDPRDLKIVLFCISFLRKGEVLAYIGSIQNLKDLKAMVVRDGRSPDAFREGGGGSCRLDQRAYRGSSLTRKRPPS